MRRKAEKPMTLNELVKQMMGRRMTKKELSLQNILRKQVSLRKITVQQAQDIWNEKVKP